MKEKKLSTVERIRKELEKGEEPWAKKAKEVIERATDEVSAGCGSEDEESPTDSGW